MLIGSRLNLEKIEDRDIIFMSPWCLPLPSDKAYCEVQPPILDSPWKVQQELTQAYGEVSSIYQKLMPFFAESLSEIHNLQRTLRFWKILIGPWLFWFINVAYDKYFRLQKAKVKNCCPLVGLPQNSFIIPKNTLDFVVHAHHDDYYNLQLITTIAYFLDFPSIPLKVDDVVNINNIDNFFVENTNNKISFKVKIYKFIQKAFYLYSDTVLYKTGHSSRFILDIFLKSKGKIVEFDSVGSEVCEASPNAETRQKLKENILTSLREQSPSHLESIIAQLAADQIPICFLEGFNKFNIDSKEKFGNKLPKKIVSSIGWYTDEKFKIWAANCADNGTKLCGLQHGGNYGSLGDLFNEKHEVEITDQYFSWGWKDNLNKKITPSPAQKLLDISRYCPTSNTSEGILYICNPGVRFVLQFPAVPEDFLIYSKNQEGFISSISPVLHTKLRIRPHHEDGVWEIQKRLSLKFEGLKFENWSLSFRDSLSNTKVILIDHLSTSFIEAFTFNIPTILFWYPKLYNLKSSAQPYYDQLRKIGILHDSGESAAQFLNQKYEDIHHWWYALECQDAVNAFCETFAKCTSKPVKDWYNLLNA